MQKLSVMALVAMAIPLSAQDEPGRPKSPEIEWAKGTATLVELKAGDAALKLVPFQPIPMGAEGRFLFGLTPGHDVKPGGGGLVMQPRAWDAKRPDPVTLKQGRSQFSFVYGGGEPFGVPVEIATGGKPVYRIPAILEVVAGDVTLCFIDQNANGWFDDLDTDFVAVGAAKDAAKLRFEKFTGEMSAAGKRWLVTASPRWAGLWPLSAAVSKDYVRSVSDVNAVRRFAGIEPVGFAEELIPLCEAHGRYCAKNGLTHYEDKAKPLFSAGGEYAGRHSNVGPGASGVAFVEVMLRTLWHRNLYIDGNLKRTSIGLGDGWGSGDVRTYGGYERTEGFSPARGQLDARLEGANENPEPYPAQARPGPFVTVLLPFKTAAEYKSGSITTRAGEALKFDWTDPAHPPEKAKQRFPDNDSCIVLIPHAPLKPDTIYDVKIVATVSGAEKTFAWSFRTKASH